MVRILFLLLILINLIYFAWNLYSPPQVVERQPAALVKDIKRLTLLSEQKLERRTLAKDSHDKTDSQLTDSPVIQSEHEQVASKDDVESVDVREGITDKITVIEEYAAVSGSDTELVTSIEETPEIEASKEVPTEREGQEVSKEAGAEDASVFPVPTTENGADEEEPVESLAGPGEGGVAGTETEKEAEISTDHTSIRIAKENADYSRAVKEDSIKSNFGSEILAGQEQIAEVSRPPVKIRRCYTLGPFEEIMAAESLLIQIQKAGFETIRRAITEQQPTRYWVYLPSVESQSAASVIAKELASKGIKDYFVITENENKNAISLGLFSKHTGARRRYKKIQALGYQPEMEVRFRDKTIYWLDYDEVDEHKLPPKIWGSLMTEGEVVQRIVRECDIRP